MANNVVYLTGGEVVSGMARKLRSGFTTTEFPEIYKNTPKQNAASSYIFISQDGLKVYNDLRNYAQLNYLMSIKFIHNPNMENEDEWARLCAFKAMEYLRWIEVCGLPVKAQDFTWGFVDNYLCVSCRYTFRVYYDDQKAKILMRDVSSAAKLK